MYSVETVCIHCIVWIVSLFDINCIGFWQDYEDLSAEEDHPSASYDELVDRAENRHEAEDFRAASYDELADLADASYDDEPNLQLQVDTSFEDGACNTESDTSVEDEVEASATDIQQNVRSK